MAIHRSQNRTQRHREAFTLIEMMVVIGIIAVVTTLAVPGLKHAYESFKINETFEHVDTFVSSLRSFYLIRSELPPDCGAGYVNENVVWCLPSNYYKRAQDENRNYLFNVKPYMTGGFYDIDVWDEGAGKLFYISIYKPGSWGAEWFGRFQKKYPNTSVRSLADQTCLSVLNGVEKYMTEKKMFNRYY